MSSPHVPLAAEICWRVWGTPANFNGFHVLAALLHDTLVVGISQTLRHWTEGATYIRQGGHHVGHWPTFLVVFILYISFDWWMCAFVVLGFVFQYQAKKLTWETSLKWPILCRVGPVVMYCHSSYWIWYVIAVTECDSYFLMKIDYSILVYENSKCVRGIL